MAQKISPREVRDVSAIKDFENVPENWVLYDTVLMGGYALAMNFHDGYQPTFAGMGGLTNVPFFNVRNRNHGLAYNNQDTRDQLPWVFKIFTIGVSFFSPSTVLYRANGAVPSGPQVTEQHIWETELPKHASLVLQTNQDERLKIASLMCPPGYGPVGGGVASGNPDIVSGGSWPNISKGAFTQGTPELTNKWGFANPLEVPRRANLSATITFSEYGRELLKSMDGPWFQYFQSKTFAEWFPMFGMFGIQVVLGGQRQVQQRGQYHA